MDFSSELIRQAYVRYEVDFNIGELGLNRNKLTANSFKKIIDYSSFSDGPALSAYEAVVGAIEIGCIISTYPKVITNDQLVMIEKLKKSLLNTYDPDLYYYIKLYIDKGYYKLPNGVIDRSKINDIRSEKVAIPYEGKIKEAAIYLGAPNVKFVGKYKFKKIQSKENLKYFFTSNDGIKLVLILAALALILIIYVFYKVSVEPEANAAAERKAYGDALMTIYGDE